MDVCRLAGRLELGRRQGRRRGFWHDGDVASRVSVRAALADITMYVLALTARSASLSTGKSAGNWAGRVSGNTAVAVRPE